jgi:hypothetical protein
MHIRTTPILSSGNVFPAPAGRILWLLAREPPWCSVTRLAGPALAAPFLMCEAI